MRQHGVRIVATWLALVVAAGVLIASPWAGAAQPPDFDALLRNEPYLPLFTESNDAGQMRTINQLTGAALETRLDDLTRWYAHFHSEGSNNWPFGEASKGTSTSTLASKLAAHGGIITNYRNGSYVSQANRGQANWGEAELLERQAPLAIATFFPGNSKPYVAGNDGASGGRLLDAVNASVTTVRVSVTPSGDRPAGTPNTWPFMASRGAGATANAHSTNTHDVATWLRIDDELMQIVGQPTASGGDTITLDVVRGLWGTDAQQHAANARIQSPVYIGSSSAAAVDAGLAGAPNQNDANATLRYAIKIWKPAGHAFIADAPLAEALREKATYASYMTTQLCFDPAAIGSWLAARCAEGLTLPVHIGLPSVAEPHKLLAITARIGVADTHRFLTKNARFVARLIRSGGFYRPDGLLEGLAPTVADPAAGVVDIHLYTFNNVAATEAWRRRFLESLAVAQPA